jgi:hypothetical protein
MTVASGQLVMAGGNQVSPALYDPASGALLSSTDIPEKPHANRGQEVALFREKYLIFGGKLLYSPNERITSTAYYTIGSGETEYRFTSGRTAPAWNDTDFVFTNGRDGITCCDADSIEELFKTGLPRLAAGPSDRDYLVDALPAESRRWTVSQQSPCETLALVLTDNAVVAVDEIPKLRGPTSFVLSAYDLQSGKPFWQQDLPGPALRDGLLVERSGRVLVALRSGEVVCYGPR